ncbi:peptide chain release factor ERF1 [Megavirus vitis]|uniref:Peptide chain release factor eRF1 n=1 Tax=Megavirus courdo7 TaxID=1128135 RepID=H2EAF1_9VIRU|nr:peptide chain release factor eRF1 [Megavirus courdo7]AVL93620.1 peptide chain release factor ERF1 [Megavirus vitis]
MWNTRCVFNSNCILLRPHHTVKKFFYKCDKKFYVDDIINMFNNYQDYAIVLISGKKTQFYTHNIHDTKLIKTLTETLPNQHKTGGQSAVRFERIRGEKIHVYIKKILDNMIQFYTSNGKFRLTGIIIAGPAELKDLVIQQDIFNTIFKQYLSKTLTISEILDNSIHKVITLSQDILDTNLNNDHNLLNKLHNIIQDPRQISLLVFGNDDIELHMNRGELKEIYVFHEYPNINYILNLNYKTIIHVIKSKYFVNQYGYLVGIKYYHINNEN